MEAAENTSGKYKKLSALQQENKYLEEHPAAHPLGLETLTLEDNKSSLRRTSWHAQHIEPVKKPSETESNVRKSDSLDLLAEPSCASSLKSFEKLNKSEPKLSRLSVNEAEEVAHASNAPIALSPVKYRQKRKKVPPPSRKFSKTTSLYHNCPTQSAPTKQRPRSTIFLPSVMRRPRTSLSGSPSSLLEALETKKMRSAFLDFLESEYSSENLCFWLSCEKFRKLKGEEQRNREGQYIYLQYISPNAPRQININHVTRRQITVELTSCEGLAPDVFSPAQRYVFSIMENDSFPRFMNSAFYKDACVSKRNTFESVIANFLPGIRTSGSTSPTRSERSNSNNNNVKDDLDYVQVKANDTVFRRFSFGFKKSHATKSNKSNRSSAPDLLSENFFNLEVKVA